MRNLCKGDHCVREGLERDGYTITEDGSITTIAKPFTDAALAEANLALDESLAVMRMLQLCGELGGIGKDEKPSAYLRRLIDALAAKEGKPA